MRPCIAFVNSGWQWSRSSTSVACWEWSKLWVVTVCYPCRINYSNWKSIQCRSRDPDSIRLDACLRLQFLHRQDRISLFNWLICLMKRALDFATKLNSRDIQKCYCFLVPSYDLFASARKTVFPAPTATVVHRLRNTWSSLWEVICRKIVQQPFLNQNLDPPPPPQ